VRYVDPDHHGSSRPRRPVSSGWRSAKRIGTELLAAALILAHIAAGVPDAMAASAGKANKAAKKIPNKLPPAPDEKRAASMVKVTLVTLNNAVQSKNFSVLWSQAAYAFRRKYTAVKLRQAFAPFIKQGVDLAPALNLNPEWSAPPDVDSHGELRLSGWFRTQPRIVRFDLRYTHERGRWRLSMIDVDTTQPTKE